MEITSILPSSVEIKYDYLKVDGIYMSTVIVTQYPTNIEILKTLEMLMGEDETEISFHIKRENNFDILKKLTGIIAKTSSEIESVSKNQIDINIIDNEKKKALELRKKIQIDNEQIYMLSTYILIKAADKDTLISKQRKYINMLYTKQLIVKPSNFRQKEAYLATLPIMLNNTIISKYTHNIFTEEAMTKLFPFFENSVLNKNGILLGKTNNNLCAIDMFSPKNNNYNMCVFGSSGAGKSYFIKLMIIRNSYKGIRQVIIDPEGEYVHLVQSLGGYVYSRENYNPFEINEEFAKRNDFFDRKVEQIIEYLFPKMNCLNKEQIRLLIIETYNLFGINNSKESLYKQEDKEKLYIIPQYKNIFPTIKDFLDIMRKHGIKIEEKLNNTEKTVPVPNNTELYCFNLKNKSFEEIFEEMKYIIPKTYELITQETLIYFDELWKCMGVGKNRYVIENIYNMFKTLRKNKAGIVTISQDICDLFSLDDGGFGKSVLNNSYIKALFKMEWQDIEMFEKMLTDKNISKRIKSLARGSAYISMGNANFNLEVEAIGYEHEIIEGGSYEENTNCNE